MNYAFVMILDYVQPFNAGRADARWFELLRAYLLLIMSKETSGLIGKFITFTSTQ